MFINFTGAIGTNVVAEITKGENSTFIPRNRQLLEVFENRKSLRMNIFDHRVIMLLSCGSVSGRVM